MGAVRRLLSVAVLLPPLSACALIDAATGTAKDGGNGGDDDAIGGGDGNGLNGDGGMQPICIEEGRCFFAPELYSTMLDSPHTVTVAHFDADGRLDIAVASQSGAKVLWGAEGGIPSGETGLSVGVNVAGMVVGSFDGDAFADVAISDHNTALKVLISGGGRDFSTYPLEGFDPTSAVIAIDFDDDSLDDLLVGHGNSLTPIENMGSNTYEPRTAFDVPGTGPFNWTVGDFGDTPNEDFAYTYDNTYQAYGGNGSGGFSLLTGDMGAADIHALARFRKQGEAKDWLAAAYQCDNCASTEIMTVFAVVGSIQGGASLTSSHPFQTRAATTGIFLSDAQEGLVLASIGGGEGDVLVLEDWNNQTFQKSILLTSGLAAPSAVATGDLNGDGMDDIVVAGAETGQLSIILSKMD